MRRAMIEHQVVYSCLRKIERRSTIPIVAACLYEAVALTFPDKRIPPITKLAHKHRWFLPVFCGIVGVHVWFYDG